MPNVRLPIILRIALVCLVIPEIRRSLVTKFVCFIICQSIRIERYFLVNKTHAVQFKKRKKEKKYICFSFVVAILHSNIELYRMIEIHSLAITIWMAKLTFVKIITVAEPIAPANPCIPSPCGPYSVCRDVNNHAVCSCIINYVGTPPACRPECTVSSECSLDKACVNQKCVDPCRGACGQNARCQVTNHNPICSCNVGYAGDPFIRCIAEESKPEFCPVTYLFSNLFYYYWHVAVMYYILSIYLHVYQLSTSIFFKYI